jgi:hypothetical protein
MGTFVEINDTLQLTTEQGFPAELDYKQHCKKPISLESVKGKLFTFRDKPSARIFQLDPVRVYYVHNINDKWLFWGHVFIQSLSIEKKLELDGTWDQKSWITSGAYVISEIYDPEYQKIFTLREAPADRNFFRP